MMMEEFSGVLLIRLQNIGSKSEGYYAFLILDDSMAAMKLCRMDAPSFNDDYFIPYDRHEVIVRGEVRHGWLVVETIDAVEEQVVNEKMNDDE